MKNTTKNATTEKITFAPITTGAAAAESSPALLKLIETNYPGLLRDIAASGLIDGSKFFGLFLRHNAGEKNFPFHVFVKNVITPKNISEKTPAPKNGKNVSSVIPATFPSLNNLKNTVFILTITRRGVSYRTAHYNLNY